MTNAQKTPLARSLPIFAQRKAIDEIQKRGRALPGHVVAVSGPIVTVAFDVMGVTLDQVTMPLFGPEYIRYPIQVGDKGACFPVDVYLGGISGLGGGTADGTLQGNLSTLVWFPVGNKNWSSVDPNALTLYGPNGVVMKDTAGNTVATLTPSGWVLNAKTTISLSVGATSLVMNSGSISLTSNGHTVVINSTGVVIDGKVFLLHDHTLVQTGGGISGPVGP